MDQFGSGRSGHEGEEGAKVEKRSESSVGDDEDRREQEIVVAQEPPLTDIARSMEGAGPNASSTKTEEVDELENAKAEMGGVIQENQRLKTCLNRILNDYRTLQIQFHNIAEQDTKNSSDKANNNNNQQEIMMEESELVSLSLGRLPLKAKVISKLPMKEEENNKEGLALGLDCKFEKSNSDNNSSELPKEEALETWPPSKVINKIVTIAGEDEVSDQQNINPAKKARVCVRARCDTLTLNDGCQWRKYGQKISKGNPCPRAYYRCTVAPSCPVRKQVQRCAQDMSILITTYEGNHNHPLPLSATAMASTTSAAASMLLSGSSTSHTRSIPSTTADLHGMNFCLSDGSKSKQLFLSHPALSPSTSHPTITLDLTSNNNPSSSSSSSFPFGRFTSNFNNPPRYPSSTSLNFSSSESNAMSWSNGLLSYNTPHSQSYNNNNLLSNLGRQQSMENNILNSYMQRNNNNVPTLPTQHSLPDTIAAATKAITADPTFQSALAAALTSIIGTGSSTAQGLNQNVGEILGKKRKWGELFPSSSSLAFSMPKSASASPDDNRG